MSLIPPGTGNMPPSPPVVESAGVASSAPAPTINLAKMRALGTQLAATFKTYEANRKLLELRWTRNLRQFLGEYDPDVVKMLDSNRSRAYPRVTRVKCVSMVSRLMNLLFPTNDKNWGLDASPVPNLSMEDLTSVLQTAQASAQKAGGMLNDESIEAAIRAFAKTRAKNLETEVEDQLAEIGGNRALPYTALCRKVISSSVIYGMGVLKGPFARPQVQRSWAKDLVGQYQPHELIAFRPQLEFVSIWDYYPDMSAKHLQDMDGQYQRVVLSKSQLRELANRVDFFGDTIKRCIVEKPNGNWKERTHETELRQIGSQSQVNPLTGVKYEVIVWEGYVSSEQLRGAGIEVPEGMRADLVDASVWMVDDYVIKCQMSPWAELEPDERVQMYHHFVFEEDDSCIVGNGLPNIMRDSAMSIAAATRMLLDNASIVCGPNLEINASRLRADVAATGISPYKIWWTEDDDVGPSSTLPVVRQVAIDGHIAELKSVVELFQAFADQETFVNPANGGDMQKGPSEPFRTAAGASMIQGQAALPYKDIIRNYDSFTTSVINAVVLFNKHFNPDREVQGDFTTIARGSSSLIAKEVRGMAVDSMVTTLQPEQRPFMKWYELTVEQLGVRDVGVDTVMVGKDEATQITAAAEQKQADDAAQMKELLTAEVRSLLAKAMKDMTGSDNNAAGADQKTAAAQVSTYKAILDGLAQGVTPSDVHAAHQGGQLPAPIARGLRLASGADKPPKAKTS